MFGHLKICTKAFEGNSKGEDLRQKSPDGIHHRHILHSQTIVCQNNLIQTVRVSTRKLEKRQNYGFLQNLNSDCMCICIMVGNGISTSCFSQVPSLSQCSEQGDEKILIGFSEYNFCLLSLHTLMAFFHNKNKTRFQNAALVARGIGPR